MSPTSRCYIFSRVIHVFVHLTQWNVWPRHSQFFLNSCWISVLFCVLFYSFGILLLQQLNILGAIMNVSFCLISSSPLFFPQRILCILLLSKGLSCFFRDGTHCALRSSHDAAFLPDKARVWVRRLNDPLGKIVSALNTNRAQWRKQCMYRMKLQCAGCTIVSNWSWCSNGIIYIDCLYFKKCNMYNCKH